MLTDLLTWNTWKTLLTRSVLFSLVLKVLVKLHFGFVVAACRQYWQGPDRISNRSDWSQCQSVSNGFFLYSQTLPKIFFFLLFFFMSILLGFHWGTKRAKQLIQDLFKEQEWKILQLVLELKSKMFGRSRTIVLKDHNIWK